MFGFRFVRETGGNAYAPHTYAAAEANRRFDAVDKDYAEVKADIAQIREGRAEDRQRIDRLEVRSQHIDQEVARLSADMKDMHAGMDRGFKDVGDKLTEHITREDARWLSAQGQLTKILWYIICSGVGVAVSIAVGVGIWVFQSFWK